MFEPQAEREATAGALDSAESMPAATEPSVKEARFWLFVQESVEESVREFVEDATWFES
jgi:hypothetical protein